MQREVHRKRQRQNQHETEIVGVEARGGVVELDETPGQNRVRIRPKKG